MDAHVYPAEPEFERTDPEAPFSWERPKIMAELRAEARRRGLWNLFLPDAERGAGLTNLQYAPLAEITGRSPQVAPEALNCAAPDTGNMELLHLHGTPEQQRRWLRAPARGRDPLGLLDDRAGRRLVRRVQHRAADDADRRRRVRPGRPQVVVDRRDERRLRAAGRHGGQRARRPPPPAALDPAGAARHSGRAGPPRPVGVRVLGRDRTAGTPRWRSTRCAWGPRPARRARARLRAGPGPPRARAHPPLHAPDRDGRAGVRPDVPARAGPRRVRQAARRAGRGPGDDRGLPDPAGAVCGCRCCGAPG